MSGKNDPKEVINSFKRRQQTMRVIIGGAAILLVIIGVVLLIVWFTGGSDKKGGGISLFATETATPTATVTVTPVTPTQTFTPSATITETPTITLTPTPDKPYEYTVKEGDICWDIAQEKDVDLATLLQINNFAPGTCPINPGDKIWIPAPGQLLPTPTMISTDTPRGTKIEYYVQSGDTLAGIASMFNSTIAKIIEETNRTLSASEKISETSIIYVGQKLIVPVNIVTPTPTRGPTTTRTVPVIPTSAPSLTPTVTVKP